MFPKEATSICKSILRNGYDAYIINAPLQEEIFEVSGSLEIDIAVEPDFENLAKIIPNLEFSHEEGLVGVCKGESGTLYRFYPTDISDASHPEVSLTRITPHMQKALQKANPQRYLTVMRMTDFFDTDKIFEDISCGYVKLAGIPELTLRRHYTLAIQVLRMAANYDLPIDPSTWIAIVQNAANIADYVPANDFVGEWRLVAAENMWRFVNLLAESHILPGLIPEISALKAIKQNIAKDSEEEEDIFQHTIDCMKHYPEENLHHDWIGTVALMFHDVGKLYTAERYNGRWTFYQHHRVAAKVTRKILRRLFFSSDDINTICGLIQNHMRFHSMLTDRGIRRFISLPETNRLIEMTRAHLKAQPNPNYTNFNHNLKYLERAETPEQMLEPLLNGKDIMEITSLPPGPEVGAIREALLQAQKDGQVTDNTSAIAFVRNYNAS